MNLEEFHSDLLEQIRINNDSYNLPSEQSLYYIYLEFLQASGQFVDDTIDIEYGLNGFNFSAFSRDTERRTLDLFVTDIKTSKLPEKIYQKDIEEYFKNLISLISTIIIPARGDLDESNPIRELTDDLCSEGEIYHTLTIWYLTNGIYSSRSLTDLHAKVNKLNASIRTIDLTAYKNMVSDQDQQHIDISTSLDGRRLQVKMKVGIMVL